MLTLGSILYISILLINATAVLSEERFLARIGWSSVPAQPGPGYNQTYAQPYDQNGYAGGPQDVGVKGRLINLIGAVRTLMRIPLIMVNVVVIVYELILGG